MTTPEDREIWERDEEALRAEVRQLNATLDQAGRDAVTEARAYVALHEKARAAEAKLARVEAAIQREGKLHSTWDKRSEMVVPVDALRAALAAEPGEQPCRTCLATGFILRGGECEGCAARGWCDAQDPKGGRACHLRSGHPGQHSGGRHSWDDAPAEQRAEDAGDCSNNEHVCSCATGTHVHAADCNVRLNDNPAEGDGRG
jgi:hypothetical protein